MTCSIHTPTDLLRQVRDLIADRARWTQGHGARAADGEVVSPDSPDACQWCVTGALWRFHERGDVADATYDTARAALNATCRPRVGGDLAYGSVAMVWVNDWGGHAAIISAIDDTISLLGHDGRAVLCITGVRADDDVGRLYIDDGRLTVAWVTGDSTETVEPDDLRSTRRRMIVVDDDSDDALFSRLEAAQAADQRYQ